MASRSWRHLSHVALWQLLLLPLAVSEDRETRKWDEMRVARVVPSRIATLPLNVQDGFGIGSWYNYMGWGKDWLWVEGIDDYSSLNSLSFQFETLDYPHEWYANAMPNEVFLRVGSNCQCRLAGIAAYTKIDEGAWLRLQFEQCLGCESRAQHAAVVIGLQASEDLDSNLFQWMCAINPTGVCAPPNSTTRTFTTSTLTTTLETTSTTAVATTTTPETTTTTTRNPVCDSLSVDTQHEQLGAGKCVGQVASAEGAGEEYWCSVACNMRYINQQVFYNMDVAQMNEHIHEINQKEDVCKGFAYNDELKSCIIYTGDEVTEVAPEAGWKCFGQVQAKPKGFEEHFDYISTDCTTKAPWMITTRTRTTTTETTTSITTTSTATTTTHTITTTTTTVVESLLLSFTFEVGDPSARVFGFPGDVHYQREGMAATLLQLQSKDCFDNVDYYMLSGTVPVLQAHWDNLMRLLKDVGAPNAWSNQREQCAASATVDRIPVDANIFKNLASSRLTWGGKFCFTVFSVAFASLLGIGLAMWGKTTYYPSGIQRPHNMNGSMFISYVVAAVLASVLAFILVYVLGLVVCALADRLAMKKLAMGGSGASLLMGPMLARLCLPVAATAAGAVFVIWLWPAPEIRERQHTTTHTMLIQYDPTNGEIDVTKPMLSRQS